MYAYTLNPYGEDTVPHLSNTTTGMRPSAASKPWLITKTRGGLYMTFQENFFTV